MNDLYNLDPIKEYPLSDEESTYQSTQETQSGFIADLVINQDRLKQISKSKLHLDKKKVFNMPSALELAMQKAFTRKNEILYCVSTKELSVDISDVSGKVYLPLITKEEVTHRLSTLSPSLRSKINMIHLGAVKILIKAQFRNGINSPIKMALIDDRINSRKDCILGAAKGNLAYGKFMFTVYPKFGFSLQTANLDKVLSFIHEFERTNFMNKGDKVFSITYLIGYALTNSHHSIAYKSNTNIELDDVFKEVGQVEQNNFCSLTPTECDWAINIAKNKTSMTTPHRHSISNDHTLHIGQSSKSKRPTYTDSAMLRSVSLRIDELGEKLNKIYDD